MINYFRSLKILTLVGVGAGLEVLAVSLLAYVLTSQDSMNVVFDIKFDLLQIIAFTGLVWVFSGIVNAFVQYKILNFSFTSGVYLAQNLLKILIERGGVSDHEKSSVDILINEIGRVIGGVFIPMFVLFQKFCFLVFTLIITVIIFGMHSLIYISVLIGSYLIIYYLIKQRIQKNGKLVSLHNNERTSVLLDLEEGRNLVRINASEKIIVENFTQPTQSSYQAQVMNQVYAVLPKYILETSVIICLLVVYAGNINSEDFINNVLITGAVAIKVLPSIQSVFSSYTLINGHINSYQFIKTQLEMYNEYENTPAILGNWENLDELVFKEVRVSRGDDFCMLATNINLKVGKVVGIIGESGSGKSTFGYAICGLDANAAIDLAESDTHPTLGKLKKSDATFLRQYWGYVPQNPFLFDDDLSFNLFHSSLPSDESKRFAEKLLIRFDLHNLLSGKHWEKIRVGRSGKPVSGGEKQRLLIASAVIRQRNFLLLDEATSALDDINSEKVTKMIDELREVCGVVMITHDQRQLKICDEVLEFKDGCIVNRYDKEDIRILWGF